VSTASQQIRARDVLGEAWELYKRHWRHVVPIALVVYLLLAAFTLFLVLMLGQLGLLAGGFVALAGVFWLQGVLVVAADDIRDGRADLTVAETLRRVRPRMNTLGIAGLLAALGIALGLALLIVPGLVLLTWWVLIVPTIMLEGRSVTGAFGRSRALVRGNGLSMFRLIVLTLLVLLGVSVALDLVLAPLDDALQGYVSDVASNTLTAPFVALAFTLAYYRLSGASEAVSAA
jgi:hypothetical protein